MKSVATILFACISMFSIGQSTDISKSSDITKSYILKPSEGKRFLLVDNMNGSINIVGTSGDEVRVVVKKTIHAQSERKARQAEESVTLDISEEPGRLLLYVNAPWRERDGSVEYRGWNYYGYDVDFDFELQVPSKLDMEIKTVNHGEVHVKGIEGEFEVHNVNGPVEVLDMAGFGKATTVNGSVVATFVRNPGGPCTFTTVNGKVETEFPDDLSADLVLKTFNGEVYTDFSVESILRKSPVSNNSERHRKVYRSADTYAVRVAKGGPEMYFDSLNGDIYIRRKM
ncbi:MAG TPA: hypothetical protein VL633_05755 [Bacteroidota bacterium]|nr:hypothetical protein [Bacteroidota bacterium]